MPEPLRYVVWENSNSVVFVKARPATLINIVALDHRPEGFPKTDIPLFYGRAVLDTKITNIEGMSGGPIFGFYKNEKNELRYWLIALQSTWLKNAHIIKACPTRLQGFFLEKMMNKYRKDQ